MAEILTDSQLRQVKRLIRGLCANYDNGCCLILDGVCPQCISYTLLCRYFKEAVLPEDRELQTAIYGTPYLRRCAVCGKPLSGDKKNTLFCRQCAGLRIRRSKREWAQKNGCKNRKS